MADFDAPSSQLVVDLLQDEIVRKKLYLLARGSAKSEADAEDLVQNALLRVLDPDDAPWDPRQVTFLVHMGRVMRQTWHEQMRRARVKREVLDETLTEHKHVVDPGPAQDSEVARAQSTSLQQALMRDVLAEIGDKHPIARQVYDLGAQGIEDPHRQAEKIGCTIDEVYLAQKQLRYHARRALERWELAEEQRMRELQEAGRSPRGKPPTEEAP